MSAASLTYGVWRGSAFERQGRVLELCSKTCVAPAGAVAVAKRKGRRTR